MPYTPHTAADVAAMLERIGVSSVDELFKAIPANVRFGGDLELPPGRTEEEVRRVMKRLAAANRGQEDLVSFLGGGVYDSIIPAAIGAIASRSEFLTAYTPYQAEVSQGTLQVIYEWQTYVCRLTGLAVANASMYDGATALAEAVRDGGGRRRKPKVVVPATLNPRYRRVMATTLRRRTAWRSSRRRGAPTALTDLVALRAADRGRRRRRGRHPESQPPRADRAGGRAGGRRRRRLRGGVREPGLALAAEGAGRVRRARGGGRGAAARPAVLLRRPAARLPGLRGRAEAPDARAAWSGAPSTTTGATPTC